ncbi:MFS transporter [Demequina sp. TTPB684]|uniref:MFS transporter n=1 Tax=unclassified Demequina TaxID=2620311 RepID=UPI001CF50F68|nr:MULTISPECIES: MFS transporter [unclassified Demequina]MCB2413405.1 MFS transporter [Demequina sp. TTPB684]UPU87968.1 MFS transporter [Demequina sp. TMPB413]
MSYSSDLAHLWKSQGFRRLTRVRVVSQAGDGAFQFGIATAFFFSPENATTPADIAIGFAVLFAPFTLIGPFVGPFIDRWHRQRIVLAGNMMRLAMVGAIVAAVVADAPRLSLYVLALATLSVNRFLLAALSAGIPQVVDKDDLLAANAIMPTLGTIAAALGGTIGGIVAFVVPGVSDDHKALLALGAAGLAFGLSSWAATALSKRSLGPVKLLEAEHVVEEAAHVVKELRDGYRHLRQRATPFHALGVMAAARLLYGLMFVASILISRNVLDDPSDPEGAIGKFAIVVGFAAVGFGLAAVVTPAFSHRIERHDWVIVCLALGGAGQALLAVSSEPWALLSAAVIVSFGIQGGKIAVDTIVQRDTDDAFRGRAFALYDVAYNTAFISAAFIGALVLPANGYSQLVMAALVVAYAACAAAYWRAPRVPHITAEA